MAAKAEANVQGRDVYLVGSVPMASPQEVFETVSAALGTKVKRIPDGETGERGDWITWREPVFANNPAFEKSGKFFRVHATGTGRERYTLKQGIAPKDVHFDNLLYADIARKSYTEFKRLRMPEKTSATKFQVDLVPAHSVIWLFLVDELHAPLDAIYNEAVKREIDKIAADIPHHELAIQFDVASAVFARLERNEASSYGRSKSEIQDTFSNIVIDLGNRVAAWTSTCCDDLCYGDLNHRHVVEPTDMGDMVDFANRVAKRISRPIQLIHMPVPRNRTDDAYFAPLKRLDLRPETELCLGLVHYTDGVAGSEKRLLLSLKKFRAKFSIATECGFGRRDPATIHDLLRIHSEVAELD